ncbi:NUDIX domain-containing protein [Candidatus Peregrinibacteria bacterium]|nr:NUDIX domain-containing protein [Candidatus Peregrinibacteria bacterium]
MKYDEKSCGIVVFREGKGKRYYLILKYPGGHFDFPKGHVEDKDADEQATAIRELHEETSIDDIKFIDGFREKIAYKHIRNKKLSNKQVIFFLGETHKEKITLSFEHPKYFWLTYKEAVKKATYANAKNLLEKAEKTLNIKA